MLYFSAQVADIDFAIREPMRADETTVLDLGAYKMNFLITPYVHA